MADSATTRLARAIRTLVEPDDLEDTGAARPTGRYRGYVTKTKPLTVTVAEIDVELDARDLALDETVRAATVETPLQAGDTLILVELDVDDFVAVGLVRDGQG